MLFSSFRGYQAIWLSADILAGVLLAAIALPEQLATARLAGMPPETGLYAFVAGTLAVAIFAANRYMSVGADSTIAPIFAATIAALMPSGSPAYVINVTVVALLVGIILLVAGLLRLGFLADVLSTPVTVGFLAGIAIRIVIGQLPSLFGVRVASLPTVETLAGIVAQLAHVNPYAIALGIGVLAITLLADRISAKIPGALIALIAAALAVAALHLESHGVAVVGALHARFPSLSIPVVQATDLRQTLPLALIVATVCLIQTSVVLRSFPSSARFEDVSQDVAAVGAGSVAAALVGAFPVDASPPRTALVAASGGKSQIAGLVAVAAVVLLVAFGSKLTAFVPEAALAGVLIFIAMRLFRLREMMRIARESRLEIILVVAAAALIVLLPVAIGVVLAIGLSPLYGIAIMARPPCVELTRVPNTTIWWPPDADAPGERVPGVVVFSPAAPIYFMNVNYIVDRMNATVAQAPKPVTLVIIEGSGLSDIDYTGAAVFNPAIDRLRASQHVTIALARLSDERAEAAARRMGLLAAIGSHRIFLSVEDAVQALKPS